jgi:ATP-dependent DNA helicase RecQ
MQERIVHSLLAGHDTCVIMPTGGGKSLCYQLPALVSGKTAIVISPLIALMQDQAMQLAQMGIPAAVLNSFLSQPEQNAVMQKARAGEYRLLYLSPERLARADTVAWLRSVPIAFFAIDEAHCISEWGHEFRPEYRNLNTLRANFLDRPIAAFTASATRIVRHDILKQLQLRDPHRYIASFHRSNLRYMVRECESEPAQSALLIRALRHHSASNVIVYAPTIKRVEETVDFLEESGIAAIPYHGKMDGDARRRNQEKWTSDEVRVLVGTIAFGLGINKADVRAVIHLSLPKSIEQYYQEAGRAGRDGNPADCLLLWQPRDAGLLGFFNNQISDPQERDRAWQRYYAVRRFVDAGECRHHQICMHFGETPKWTTCGSCDVCGCDSDWLAKPVQTPLSGKRGSVEVPLPLMGAPTNVPAELYADAALREYMREWRRLKAREQGVSAFIVMYDTTLEAVCRLRPISLEGLREIPGFGERKIETYGREILKVLQRFEDGARAADTPLKITKPAAETLRLLAAGNTFEQIATMRGRQVSTVISTVADLVEKGEVEFQDTWVDKDRLAIIEAACEKLGTDRLSPLKEALPPEFTYGEIRLVAARLRRLQQPKTV